MILTTGLLKSYGNQVFLPLFSPKLKRKPSRRIQKRRRSIHLLPPSLLPLQHFSPPHSRTYALVASHHFSLSPAPMGSPSALSLFSPSALSLFSHSNVNTSPAPPHTHTHTHAHGVYLKNLIWRDSRFLRFPFKDRRSSDDIEANFSTVARAIVFPLGCFLLSH